MVDPLGSSRGQASRPFGSNEVEFGGVHGSPWNLEAFMALRGVVSGTVMSSGGGSGVSPVYAVSSVLSRLGKI